MTTTAMAAARDAAYSVPLASLDMSDPQRFADDTIGPYFERMRREAPVHYCENSPFGPYWSITRYNDIMATDTNHKVFSSKRGITLSEPRTEDVRLPMFIAMDPPKHDEQRLAVSPIVAPGNLANLEGVIRSRVIAIIESLPINQTFNWVDRVSIELTTQMLATLFDFPFEDRRLLTHWSDTATKLPVTDADWDARELELQKCLQYFVGLWNERVNAPPKPDLVSMLAHNPATRDMPPREFLGNLVLLIVGGNDTTRNSISGGLYFLNKNPGEYDKLRKSPAVIPNMVSEIIRYQTPLAYMRRIALTDVVVHDKTIKAGDKVAMWYVSGNRDAEVIENPDQFIIDRPRARQHLSFGFGVHRCVGNRLAEMQLRILWEELLKRYPNVEVVGEPTRIPSSFVRGYADMQVRISA
ncbi:MAG: cytochrome P450 [Hyphomicrobiaceae bacterium]|nr:cytochrome P450 [Hyphomicrobiaceae bacterium]